MNNALITESLNRQLGLNKDSKILVVGLGETGLSVARFLQQQAIKFAVIDSREKPPCNDALFKEFPDTAIFTGDFDRAAFEVATHLLVSPGLSLQEQAIRIALQSGVRLISDIDLFACATDRAIIAITGSNGKSTVTSMLGEMGNSAGVKTAIGGNLGTAALDLLNESVELYVLELSSFQLERTCCLNATVATVLNISADHQDRHDDIDDYASIKQRVFSGKSIMVINEDDPIVKKMSADQADRKLFTFSINNKSGFHLENRQGKDWLMNDGQPLMQNSELSLEGLHNTANALAALALGTAVGLNSKIMCEVLRSFKGLKHRMQKVAKVNGVTWINDSKATNIGACVAALQGCQDKVILIAGGDAKGADLSPLIPVIKEKTRCVVLMGKDADLLESKINGCVPSYRAKTIKQAVQIAADMAEKGESVLLSPACASLDQYKNYQERGEQFTVAVMDLAA